MKTITVAILALLLSACAVYPAPNGGAYVAPLPPYPAYPYGGWHNYGYDRMRPWRSFYYRPYYRAY